jgi:hypothetical protein
MFITQPLSQRDPRWRHVRLGFSGLTIGSDGCTLTCLTMIANGLGYSETPATLNDKLRALGLGKGYRGPRMVWAGLPRALPQIKLAGYIGRDADSIDMQRVDAALAANKPVLCEVDLSPAPGFQNHWILLVAKEGDDYVIHDPWTVPALVHESLRKRYGYAGGPARIIKRILFYDNPAFSPGSPEAPETMLDVRVKDSPEIRAYGGVPVREAPAASSAILAIAPPGAALRCLESAMSAHNKIGVFGEWLRVTTGGSAAVQGHVAAWLTHLDGTGDGDDAGDSPAVVQPALERFATVTVTRSAKLRNAPSKGKILATVSAGEQLVLDASEDDLESRAKKRGQWLKVKRNGNEGFVSSSFVSLGEETGSADTPVAGDSEEALQKIFDPKTPADARPLLRVISTVGLNLREAPSYGSRAKRVLRPGTLIQPREALDAARPKIGLRGQWLAVKTLSGIDGFVAAEYVTPVTLPDSLAPRQGVVFAAADTELIDKAGGSVRWAVSAGTPMQLLRTADWSRIGDASAAIRVRTYAGKEGYARGSHLRVPILSDRRAMVNDQPQTPGTSAWIYGMRGPYARELFSASKTGWVLFDEHMDAAQASGSRAYEGWKHNGFGVIAALNVAPEQMQYASEFAARCAAWVRGSTGCRMWIIADGAVDTLPPDAYAALFNQARAAIKAIQPAALVLCGAIDPYRPGAAGGLERFQQMLHRITDLEGIALRASTGSGALDLAESLAVQEAACGQFEHLRAYAAFLDRVPARFRRKPVFVTRAGVRRGPAQPGWVQRAYGEIARFNALPHAQQIQSLVLEDNVLAQQLADTVQATDYRWRA